MDDINLINFSFEYEGRLFNAKCTQVNNTEFSCYFNENLDNNIPISGKVFLECLNSLNECNNKCGDNDICIRACFVGYDECRGV